MAVLSKLGRDSQKSGNVFQLIWVLSWPASPMAVLSRPTKPDGRFIKAGKRQWPIYQKGNAFQAIASNARGDPSGSCVVDLGYIL